MMKIDWKEGKENKVTITDFDALTVQAAVEYCYDRPLTKFSQNAIQLLCFADKYFINDLRVSF